MELGMSVRPGDGQRLLWLEVSKAIALLLIIFNHALERMGVYPSVFNPNSDWSPLSERISQLKPTTGGAWDVAFNAIRYPGLLGEVGVQVFVIASGLGLMLSAMRRSGLDKGFLRRRIERIAPTWITVHILALIASIPLLLLLGGGMSDRVAAPWDIRFWASLVGFRITPETIYYLVPAWWFIALLIQLYLVFPLLYRWFVRLGPVRYWYVIGGSIVIKLAGLLFFDTYLDAWSRGAIFVTRLPEFAFGMIVAHWLTAEDNPLRRASTLGLSVLAIPLGIASGLTLAGNAWGPFLYGAGLFVVLYRIFDPMPLQGRLAKATIWVGMNSLVLFIIHQPIVIVFMPGGVAGPIRVVGGLAISLLVTLIAAPILNKIVGRAERIWNSWSQREVALKRLAAIVTVAAVGYLLVVGADLWVRANDPQEVLGWGERPSLIEDDDLGWRLAPEQTTRLRWQSYDYTVAANRFGFPGSANEPAPGDTRILTLGDAFTSAEGVDTDDAWPRLLESMAGDPATVWNGGITGFGPPQYLTVAERLVPELQPDIVIVAFFVNDFGDSEFDLEDMQEGIGFGAPDPTGLVASLRWQHLSKYLRFNFTEPVLSMAGMVNRTGYFLGQFGKFEPGAIDQGQEGYRLALEAMRELRDLVPDVRLVMMLVPASIQVCQPEDLEYFPDNVDLASLDLEQPQRLAREVATAADMEVLDLLPVLRSAGECPYQAANMHWTEYGHEVVANAVAEYLAIP